MLVGVGVAAAMVSVVQYLLARSSTWDVQLALRWLVGSVNNVPWSTIGLLAVALAVLLPLARRAGPRAARPSSSATTPPPGWASGATAPTCCCSSACC